MSEATNEQIATDRPNDVEGHNARVFAAPEEGHDVEGHYIKFGAVPTAPLDSETDDVEGHGRASGETLVEEDDDTEGHNFKI